jgi:hypothetical protein
MIWTLALMLWQLATPLPPKQYYFRQTRPFTRPTIVTPYGKTTLVPPDKLLRGESPAGKCSIPLVNAPGFKIAPNAWSMPMVRPGDVDPKMVSAPPAPPCENWFKK